MLQCLFQPLNDFINTVNLCVLYIGWRVVWFELIKKPNNFLSWTKWSNLESINLAKWLHKRVKYRLFSCCLSHFIPLYTNIITYMVHYFYVYISATKEYHTKCNFLTRFCGLTSSLNDPHAFVLCKKWLSGIINFQRLMLSWRF